VSPGESHWGVPSKAFDGGRPSSWSRGWGPMDGIPCTWPPGVPLVDPLGGSQSVGPPEIPCGVPLMGSVRGFPLFEVPWRVSWTASNGSGHLEGFSFGASLEGGPGKCSLMYSWSVI
jgi:hypothetical protein